MQRLQRPHSPPSAPPPLAPPPAGRPPVREAWASRDRGVTRPRPAAPGPRRLHSKHSDHSDNSAQSQRPSSLLATSRAAADAAPTRAGRRAARTNSKIHSAALNHPSAHTPAPAPSALRPNDLSPVESGRSQPHSPLHHRDRVEVICLGEENKACPLVAPRSPALSRAALVTCPSRDARVGRDSVTLHY